MSQFFFNFFSGTYLIDQIYLKAIQLSRCIKNPVELLRWCIFCKISGWLLAVKYFHGRTSSQKLNWVLNAPLVLSSNVIWHAYKLIVETKIFRLGVSLICPLCVMEEWIDKKMYYRKMKYITSNTKNFKVYLQ